MGLVEIVPLTGVYDYKTKYTKGASEYLFPAPIPAELTAAIGEAAARLFAACGCRDFARGPMSSLSPDGRFDFLEINTMPGMTATSLMPKSASCVGVVSRARAPHGRPGPRARRPPRPPLTMGLFDSLFGRRRDAFRGQADRDWRALVPQDVQRVPAGELGRSASCAPSCRRSPP
jgi:hypothetical protein